MSRKARFFAAADRRTQPYTSFENAYAGGDAKIAPIVGVDVSATLGCGVVTYRRVKTTWRLPFDEIIYIIAGKVVVTFGTETWSAGPGDVLFFPKDEPIGYDVSDEVTVFYTKYPVTASTIA